MHDYLAVGHMDDYLAAGTGIYISTGIYIFPPTLQLVRIFMFLLIFIASSALIASHQSHRISFYYFFYN